MSITIRFSTALLAAAALAGCANDATAPRGPILLTAAPSSQLAQAAPAGTAASVVPAVKVEIGRTPIPNLEVEFTVTRGGGSVAKTVVKTNAQGVADCGAWMLGAAGANEVRASIDGGPSLAFGAFAISFATDGDMPSMRVLI